MTAADVQSPGSKRCLTDDELVSLVDGLAKGTRRDELMLHLDVCPGCRLVLAEAARHLKAQARVSPGSWVRAAAVVSALLLVLLAWWLVAAS